MFLISLRFIKEVEDRTKDNLVEEVTGEDIGLIVEIVMKVVEVMDVVEVILGEVIFEEDISFKVDIIMIIEQIEIGRIGEYGGNPGQEKEKEKEIEIVEVSHHLVPDRDQGLVQIEIGLDALNAESMTTLQMNVLIWFLIIQIGKVIVQGQYHCIWLIVTQDQI